MSGHSQFSNIKHKKEKADGQRAKIFTKLAKEIAIAIKEGGVDPQFNPRLSLAIEKAKDANMPKENIDRALKKGSGEGENQDLFEIRYEGYGPHGAAFIAEALTDNKNRTASLVRHMFQKHGGALGETGSVSWLFDKKAVIYIDKEPGKEIEEQLMEKALGSGAEDIKEVDNRYMVTSAPTDLYKIKDDLSEFKISEAEIIMLPKEANIVVIDDQEMSEQLMKFYEALDDLDDVQNVYTNCRLNN